MNFGKKVNVIYIYICFCELFQPDVPDFWPLPNQIMDCGSFSVCLIDERFECEYIYRDFLLQSTEV